MEPQIRYAKSTDGVNIAYFAMGSGVPYVRMPTAPMDHIQLRYSSFAKREAAAIASRMRFVCYDGRGAGMSTRDVSEFSMDTFLEDLRSVVDGVAAERFVLEATNQMAPVALSFAATHPGRVSHLVIRSGVARNRDLWTRRVASTHDMLTNAPEVYRAAIASMLFGAGTQAADAMAAYMAQCSDPNVARRMYDVQGKLDATALLPEIHAPALVTVEAHDSVFERESITRLAASISATLAVVAPTETLEAWAMSGVPETLAFLVELGVIERRPDGDDNLPAVHPAAPSGFRTILFTDLVGHTEMMRRLGDDRGREVLREHERITRELLKQFGGAEVKTMGDGFMASFASVTKAMDCAISLQRAFGAHEGEPLQVRVGLNAGEPIEEDGDLFGSTVIMASRIAAKAGAGEILIPEPLRHLLTGKSYVYADRGETMLKGFEDPVRLYEVRWRR
jgi:class 3 adenylate cyclase/pimeloyl-ACP methyl ester carboxylesterase